jgi:hypothetical protein
MPLAESGITRETTIKERDTEIFSKLGPLPPPPPLNFTSVFSAQIYRPSFRENKPKTPVLMIENERFGIFSRL